jgi:hypothetical protein
MSSIIPLCAGLADLRQYQRRLDAHGAGAPQKAIKNGVKCNFDLALGLHCVPQRRGLIAWKSPMRDLFLVKPAASCGES